MFIKCLVSYRAILVIEVYIRIVTYESAYLDEVNTFRYFNVSEGRAVVECIFTDKLCACIGDIY
jgi:hypothetical protein